MHKLKVPQERTHSRTLGDLYRPLTAAGRISRVRPVNQLHDDDGQSSLNERNNNANGNVSKTVFYEILGFRIDRSRFRETYMLTYTKK